MKKLIFGVTTALVVVAATVVYYGCNKEEKTVVKSEITEDKAIRKLTFGGEVSKKGYKGEGKGSEKTCVADSNHWCWLWGSATMDPSSRAIKWSVTVEFGCISDGKDSGKGSIILDAKYQNNTAEALEELFDLNEGLFVIEKDVVEEGGSYFSEMMGTTLPCKIPAGIYSITIYDEGIKVSLPVCTTGVLVPTE